MWEAQGAVAGIAERAAYIGICHVEEEAGNGAGIIRPSLEKLYRILVL
jgi:hypothetical protein